VSRDPAIRKLLCKLLAHPAYHTHQLEETAQLHSELQVRKVDLLITDLELPEQQGLETVAALRSKHPRLKIIALSGLCISGVPGSIVLTKPFRREVLIESVQNALAEATDTRLPVI
jgi:DNA-binding response OmpR family regulator